MSKSISISISIYLVFEGGIRTKGQQLRHRARHALFTGPLQRRSLAVVIIMITFLSLHVQGARALGRLHQLPRRCFLLVRARQHQGRVAVLSEEERQHVRSVCSSMPDLSRARTLSA